MALFDIETNLTLGNTGESTQAHIDPFGVPLAAMTNNNIQLNALQNSGYNNQELVDHLVDGTIKFAYGSGNRIPTESDEFMWAHLFGMEADELASWWYSGTPGIGALVGHTSPGEDSGEGIYAAQIAAQPTENRGGVAGTHDYSNMIVFPMMCVAGESGGWYKESITMKKLSEGFYSDGTKIKIRLADEAAPAHRHAFPNCETPGSIAGVTPLGAVQSGDYTALEFASPVVDSSQINGLFPAYPDGAGGVISAGLTHYYMSSWHTPHRGRILMVTKDWYLTLTAPEQAMIRAAALSAHLQNMANQLANQDAIIKRFQELGATVHESLPRDVLLALRQGVDEVYDDYSIAPAGTSTPSGNSKGPEYQVIRDHQRLFIKANQVRWRATGVDSKFRFNARLDYKADLQIDG